MNAALSILGQSFADDPLKQAFLKWQCRVRQMAMRDNFGRPDDGITPRFFWTGMTLPWVTSLPFLTKHLRIR